LFNSLQIHILFKNFWSRESQFLIDSNLFSLKIWFKSRLPLFSRARPSFLLSLAGPRLRARPTHATLSSPAHTSPTRAHLRRSSALPAARPPTPSSICMASPAPDPHLPSSLLPQYRTTAKGRRCPRHSLFPRAPHQRPKFTPPSNELVEPIPGRRNPPFRAGFLSQPRRQPPPWLELTPRDVCFTSVSASPLPSSFELQERTTTLGDYRGVFPTAGRRRLEVSPSSPRCPTISAQFSRHLHVRLVHRAMEMLQVHTSSCVHRR
jgi:hypothetical protein